MDVRSLIEKKLRKRGEVKASEIVAATGLSRTYVNRIFQEMERQGRVSLVGKANRARYVPATPRARRKARAEEQIFHRILTNRDLSEDVVLDEIKKQTGIFDSQPNNVARILDYAFTEMLNNAIEHSRSQRIEVKMHRSQAEVSFVVIDWGIGIFKNIMKTRGLSNELAAIQDLLKGKQTTAPERHSGEGIFFTSKVADVLKIKGSNKALFFDNRLNDVFITDAKPIVGTKVEFSIAKRSRRRLRTVFEQYGGAGLEFAKTSVSVELYKMGADYVSRSQARRLLAGLEKFRSVVLDFKDVETIGQAFADEVFRVWKNHHPEIRIEFMNANENVAFMIHHVQGT